jgi:hypothetical protein
MIFASGDNPNINKHPSLTITYTLPAVVCISLNLNSADEDATVDNYNPGNNYPDGIDYTSRAWTISSVPVTWRCFFKFNLQCIPSNAVVTNADLSLFWADTNGLSNSQHMSLTSSNESVIQRVTSAWTENNVTWNNQPAFTTVDQVILPQSTSGTQDYLNLNVTQQVQQMISGSNNGFLLHLTNETYYAQMVFASGDNPHINKRPFLEVCYSIPTSVNEIAGENNITIFPNPATEQLTINQNENNNDVTVNIFNSIGEIIGSWKMMAGTNELKINIQSFSSGIYFVKVSDREKQYGRKLIVE